MAAMHASVELSNGTQMFESLAVLERKIFVVESEQAKVHAALEGRGNYLGIRDHDTLVGMLASLNKNEEQLREEKLLILRATPSISQGSGQSESFRDLETLTMVAKPAAATCKTDIRQQEEGDDSTCHDGVETLGSPTVGSNTGEVIKQDPDVVFVKGETRSQQWSWEMKMALLQAVLENNVYTTSTLKVDESFQLILDGFLKDPSKFPMFKNKTAKTMRSYWDKQILGKHKKLYMNVDGSSSSAMPPTESMELQLYHAAQKVVDDIAMYHAEKKHKEQAGKHQAGAVRCRGKVTEMCMSATLHSSSVAGSSKLAGEEDRDMDNEGDSDTRQYAGGNDGIHTQIDVDKQLDEPDGGTKEGKRGRGWKGKGTSELVGHQKKFKICDVEATGLQESSSLEDDSVREESEREKRRTERDFDDLAGIAAESAKDRWVVERSDMLAREEQAKIERQQDRDDRRMREEADRKERQEERASNERIHMARIEAESKHYQALLDVIIQTISRGKSQA